MFTQSVRGKLAGWHSRLQMTKSDTIPRAKKSANGAAAVADKARLKSGQVGKEEGRR